MGQITRLKAAGSSLPGSHGLFLVASNELPVVRNMTTIPMVNTAGLRLVRAGDLPQVESAQKRRQRGILERISRVIRAFKAS